MDHIPVWRRGARECSGAPHVDDAVLEALAGLRIGGKGQAGDGSTERKRARSVLFNLAGNGAVSGIGCGVRHFCAAPAGQLTVFAQLGLVPVGGPSNRGHVSSMTRRMAHAVLGRSLSGTAVRRRGGPFRGWARTWAAPPVGRRRPNGYIASAEGWFENVIAIGCEHEGGSNAK